MTEVSIDSETWAVTRDDVGKVTTYVHVQTLFGSRDNGVHAVRQQATAKRTYPLRRLYTCTAGLEREQAVFVTLAESTVDGYKEGEFPRILAAGDGWFVLDAHPDTTLTNLYGALEGQMPLDTVMKIGRQGRRLLRKVHACGYVIRNLSLDSFTYRNGRLQLVDVSMAKSVVAGKQSRRRLNGGWLNQFSSARAHCMEPNEEDDFAALQNILAFLQVGAYARAKAPPAPAWTQTDTLLTPLSIDTYGVNVYMAVGARGQHRRMLLGNYHRLAAVFSALHALDSRAFPAVLDDNILDCPPGRTLTQLYAMCGGDVPMKLIRSVAAQAKSMLRTIHRGGWVLRNISADSFVLHNNRLYLVDVFTARKAKAGGIRKSTPWVNLYSSPAVKAGATPIAKDDNFAFNSVLVYLQGGQKIVEDTQREDLCMLVSMLVVFFAWALASACLVIRIPARTLL